MTEKPDSSDNSGPIIGDLAGTGQIINSEVAKRTYSEGLSPAMKQIGGLTEDVVKSCRLCLAPIQYLAAFQDRFQSFCEKVRTKVPEDQQQDAPPEIAKPVIEAFASTSDDSPLMAMFEELMAKAIDKREADKLSPEFPALIKSLSPLEALLIADLAKEDQTTDDFWDSDANTIMRRVKANFDFMKFGDSTHHLTLTQTLKEKNLVHIKSGKKVNVEKEYPQLVVPEGLTLQRTLVQLTMYGRWFAEACVAK